MSEFIAATVSCICLLIYVPAISKGLQTIQQRKVMMTRWRIFSIRITQFTETAAIVHGAFQILRSSIVIFGAATAIMQGDVRIVLWAYMVGWLVGLAGMWLAKQVQVGEAEFEFKPNVSGGIPSPFGGPDFNPDDFVDADAVMSYTDGEMVIDVAPALPDGEDSDDEDNTDENT
jgi:hypothetical protein